MENPFPRPMTLDPVHDHGFFVHYSQQNVYGIRFLDLYDEEEPDNWLATEILAGRYTLYRVGESNLFQAIRRTTARADREIIELYLAPEIDRPLAEGQVTIPADSWTVDEYPGIAESIRYDPMPPPQLAPLPPLLAAQHPWISPSTRARAAISDLLVAALLLNDPPHTPMPAWDLGLPNPEPITAPLMLATNCYRHPPKPAPKVQKRVADLMIADAVSKGETCSITLNPLTQETATCVAPCYHIFEKEAIQTWLATKHTCPECREPCSL